MFNSKINWENELSTIEAMSAEGHTLQYIADKYVVSKQRLHQVFKKYKLTHVGLKKKKLSTKHAWLRKWGDKQDTGLYAVQRDKFRAKKANAKRTGIEFTIEFGDLNWPKFCPILGIEINYFAETREEASCSFDRIDTSKGYVPGNVQVLSWRANRIKNDGSAEEHRLIAEHMCSLQENLGT